MNPTMQEARSRQTAMEAERHWWVSRLKKLRSAWSTFGSGPQTGTYDSGYRDACAACAAALDEMIQERTR